MSNAFELRREGHAIAEFHASIHLYQGVSGGVFARVTERLRKLAIEYNLPAAVPIQIFQFHPHGQVAPQMAPGVGYQRFAENGEVVMAVLCDADSITITSRDYQGWAVTRGIVLSIFTELMTEYIVEMPAVQSVRLQYLNEFRSDPSRSAGEIFKTDSAWITPFVLTAEEDWHCNVGRYIGFSPDRRDLVNVNSSATTKASDLGEAPRLFVMIGILAGCYYNIPGQNALIIEPDRLLDQLADNLDAAHKLEKWVLAETIAPSYLDAMGATNVN